MRLSFLVVMFLCCGCAAYGSMRSDYEACLSNSTCVAQMERARSVSTAATRAASDGVLPTIVGSLVSLVVGIFSGHKLSKNRG